MEGKTRERILSPIRGGKQSQKTVDQAIELALSESAHLYFLYIVDVDFLGYATVARVKLMVDELRETGYFAMSMLCDKARARGVENVEALIREGNIEDVVVSVAKEIHATRLVMGHPVRNPGVKSFTPRKFSKFIETIRESTGLEIHNVE